MLSTLLDAAEKAGSRLPSLHHVSGLDAPQTIQRLHETTGAKFWTGFGQSETTGFVSHRARGRTSPGRPASRCRPARSRWWTTTTATCPRARPARSWCAGPLVFQGYYAQPDVTAYTLPRRLAPHRGRGRFDDEGYLYYVKRKPEKELIKPGGENVYPAEVETVIMQMAGVTGVCVYGIPDAKWGEAIKAVVEVTDAERPLRPVGGRLRGLEDRALQAAARGGVHRLAPPRGGAGRWTARRSRAKWGA